MKSEVWPFQGRYLFHLHTTSTDGELTVRQYFEYASQQRIQRLIFLEHIRRNPQYDVEAFVGEVKENSQRCRIPAVVGFEAKLLPDGRLDILDRHAAMASVLGIAEHGFPDDIQMLQTAFMHAVDTYSDRMPPDRVIWVHPGLWFQKRGLLGAREGEYAALIRYAVRHGVLIERNLRYNLIPEQMLACVPDQRVVVGADAHRLAHLQMSGCSGMRADRGRGGGAQRGAGPRARGCPPRAAQHAGGLADRDGAAAGVRDEGAG